jgi:spore coat polysaccharide biosynthesis predicted glycosyltransferase SpsG
MVEHVMLTFGANDPANMTQRILKRLCNQYPRIRKTVVLGKGLANSRGVTEAKDSRTKLVRNASAKAMKNIMTESDVAITACGQTLYELARVGVPAIGIAVAENQLGNARGWEKSGFLEYAGWWTDSSIVEATLDSFERLAQASIRRHRADVGRSFVDGKGSVRVAECALEKSGRA